MNRWYLAAALTVGSAVLAYDSIPTAITERDAEASSRQQPQVINFPQVGSVSIRTTRPLNGFPTITFTTNNGQVLFTTRIGTDNSVFRINPLENRDGRENPVLRYLIVDGPALGSKAVFAAAMYGGGSDCEYQGTLIGAHKGQLRSWLPKQAFTNAEGGMYVGDLGDHRGYGFAVWNFIWGSEGHVDPHHFNVKLFRFDSSVGKMAEIADLNTTGTYRTDEEALAEFGMHYPNLLRSISDFDC